MKLREFVPTKIERSAKHVKTYMLINLKYGILQLSGAAVDLTKASAGDNVSFHQDEDDPESWYMEILPEGSAGFPLRGKNKRGVRGLMFTCKALALRISESCGMEDYKGRITIAREPVIMPDGKQLWVLVTASLKPQRLD